MEKEKFNKKKYDINFRKNNYLQFKVDLKREEKLELDSLLKKKNITKAQFLRNAIEELKKK